MDLRRALGFAEVEVAFEIGDGGGAWVSTFAEM
jgi:hypothetical protein